MLGSVLRRPKVPFGQVPNELLNDDEISLKAKGLYGYMQSKPDGWSFSHNSIAAQSKDGVDSVKTAMNELKRAGWLSYRRSASGGGEYVLHWEPLAEKPLAEKPLAEKPLVENPPVLVRKKEVRKKEVKKKGDSSARTTKPKRASELDLTGLPISEVLAAELVDYRKRVKKSPLTQRALSLLAKKIDGIAKEKGVEAGDVLGFMQEKGWLSIESSWKLDGLARAKSADEGLGFSYDEMMGA